MSQTTQKSRKKVVATAMLGGLLSLGMVGGTFAALHQTIQTASDAHRIYSDEVGSFGFIHHENSQTINANISLDEPTTSAEVIVENIGVIPAQYAFYVNRSTVGSISPTNPIWDETLVTVGMSVFDDEGAYGGLEKWAGTLREFLNTAYVSNHVLQPGAQIAVYVTIIPATPYSWSSEEIAAAVDIDFATRFTFSQITSADSSALLAYAQEEGEQRNLTLRDGVFSNMEKMWTVPSADIQTISY